VDGARKKLEVLRGGANQDTLDSAQLGTANADASLQAAQIHLDQLRRGPAPAELRAAQDAVAQAQAALDRARAGADASQDSGSDAGTGGALDGRQKAIDKDNADVAKLQSRLAATDITAPFAGTVVSVFFRVGDTTDEHHTVVSIAKPGMPIVRATITPVDFDKVSVGQAAFIQLPAQSDTGPSTRARVTSLKPNDSGSAKIAEFAVDWSDTAQKLGTVMNVGLVLQQKDDALLVPKKAVHTTGSRAFVELVDGTKRRVTTVQVGIVAGNDAEIVSGLTPGQLVIVGP
jgi:multidrug efflux pump subunit AcrA (membrane-fusion protein)